MLNHTRSYKIWTLTGRLVHQYKCESMGDELWEAMWQGAPHGTFAPPKVGAIATVQQDSKLRVCLNKQNCSLRVLNFVF